MPRTSPARSRTRRGLPLLAIALTAALAITSCSSTTTGSATAGDTHMQSASGDRSAPSPDPSLPIGETQSPHNDQSTTDTAPARDKIIAALQAGEIDEPTSMLYRTWALFGDPALPEEFQGPPAPHDLAFVTQLTDSLDELPPDIADQIKPYLMRPSDIKSAFSGDHPSGLRAAGSPLTAGETAVQRCASGWTSKAEGGNNPTFRAWVCNDIGDNHAVENALDAVLDIVEQYSGPMTVPVPDGMGAPIPDDPAADATNAADELIDMYVLPHGWMAPPRDRNERVMDEMAAAITMPTAPRTSTTASGYILLAANMLDYPAALERAIVHEIFHVLQYAHWRGIDMDTAWIYEASATWAETYYAPELATPVHARLPVMQASPLSLIDSDFAHRYAAYPWFTFMYQQAGPYGVFGFWSVLGTHTADTSNDAVISSLQALVDLPTEFPEFVIRLLNADLSGDPISPRLSAADPTFPDGQIPVLPPQEFADDTLTLDHAGIPGLGYRYTRVAASNPDGPGVSVTITPTLTTASGTEPTLDALVETPSGHYTRLLVSTDGQSACVAGEILLVVANIATDAGNATTGSVVLTRDESQACDGVTAPPSTSDAAPPTQTSSAPPPKTSPVTSTPVSESDFCVDFKAFALQVAGIADLAMLPYTDADVERIFGFAQPYLANLPDGAADQIAILRDAAQAGAGLSAADAAEILDDPAVRQASTSVDATYVMYCSG